MTNRHFPDGSYSHTITTDRPPSYDLSTGQLRPRRNTPKGQAGPFRQWINQENNIRRASRNCRNLIRANELRRMFTLTFPNPEGIHDVTAAALHVRKFLHRHPAYFHGCYIYVAELHPSGHGWHIHLLTGHYVDVSILRLAWTRYLASAGITSPSAKFARTHVKLWPSARHAARYAAKYITKAFDANELPMGSHRYHQGDHLRPVDTTTIFRNGSSFDAVVAALNLPADAFCYDSETDRLQLGPPFRFYSWEPKNG